MDRSRADTGRSIGPPRGSAGNAANHVAARLHRDDSALGKWFQSVQAFRGRLYRILRLIRAMPEPAWVSRTRPNVADLIHNAIRSDAGMTKGMGRIIEQIASLLRHPKRETDPLACGGLRRGRDSRRGSSNLCPGRYCTTGPARSIRIHVAFRQ